MSQCTCQPLRDVDLTAPPWLRRGKESGKVSNLDAIDVRELHLRLAQCFAAFASTDAAYLNRAAITP
jgi:hypothetical protein